MSKANFNNYCMSLYAVKLINSLVMQREGLPEESIFAPYPLWRYCRVVLD